MSQQFIKATSGWIPVSVLLLFAVALVTAQARANLPNQAKSTPQWTESPSISVELDRDTLSDLDSMPLVLKILLELPNRFELTIDTTIATDPKDNGSVLPTRGGRNE